MFRLRLKEGILPLLSSDKEKEVLELSMNATRDRVVGWYGSLPDNWFDNPEPYKDGTSRRTGARSFVRGLQNWRSEVTGPAEFEIFFTNPDDSGSPYGLRLQQYGGDIRPVQKRALTIPVTGEARKSTVEEFEAATGEELFLVKKSNASDPSLIGTLCWEDEVGALHAAYALRTRAHIAPLIDRRGHEALPKEETLYVYFSSEYWKEFLKNG